MQKNGKNLVIVESPAKAKTINKYLGSDYVVKASMGHVRDLPRKGMGVDLDTFEPTYEISENRNKVIKELKKLAKDAQEVYLATDLDREGEAIAWHLREALRIPPEKARRVVFNAITKAAIQAAFDTPLEIDEDKVNAQQARRILDRIVGYEISPLLWRKVMPGLSAGRVQSVAVRLIVEREKEISGFTADEYWKLDGIFTPDRERLAELSAQWGEFLGEVDESAPTRTQRSHWLRDHSAFEAELVEFAGKKTKISDSEQASRIAQLIGLEQIEKQEQLEELPEGSEAKPKLLVTLSGQMPPEIEFTIKSIEKKRTSSRPGPPLITSTLQQVASTRFGFSASRTMRLAQTLYENGYITYMRTDSTNLSPEAIQMARGYVQGEFGAKYLPDKPPRYASRESAQEAHEAIRPTDASFSSLKAKSQFKGEFSGAREDWSAFWKLYSLIWERFLASQMSPAQFDSTAVTIVRDTSEGPAVFRATGRRLVFDGYMKVSGVHSEDQLLPELAEGDPLYNVRLNPSQHFTQPPPRFTEASLVKALEAQGIGRPSTYASIIQTIQDRKYVEQMKRRFYATQLGEVVTDRLIAGFPDILDVQFTADMENKLDAIEEQHLDWIKLLQEFYGPFHSNVENAMEVLKHAGGSESPYDCEKCGEKLIYRISKNGFFLACSGYPECNHTLPVDAQGKPTVREETEHRCPECSEPMIRRKGRFGEFLGCSGYPNCKTILNLDKEGNIQPPKPKPLETELECSKCSKPLYLRNGKRGPWLGCSGFPKCKGRASFTALPEPQQAELKEQLQKHESEQQSKLKLPETATVAAKPPPRNEPIATDIDCEECSRPLVVRFGKRGPFLACSGFPKCRNTADIPPDLLQELEKGDKPVSDKVKSNE